ncbi:MAG: TRAP transporter small permease subunit [Thermodesulfobacteriota bacterium]
MATLFRRLEDGFLCLLLAVTTGLACWQIVLRFFFAGGLVWADGLLRYLVLWSGLFGAVIATREGRHIAIDIVSHLVPGAFMPSLRLVIDLFSALVSGVLTWAAVVFVQNERLYGGEFLLAIPFWGWNLVFPIAFGLITLRFLAAAAGEGRSLLQIRQLRQGGE